VILAVVLGSLVTIAVVTGLAWTARKLSISTLDAQALTAKLAVPDPVSAMDWPELKVRAVIPQPGEPSLVMLDVVWPEHPRRTATLLVALSHSDNESVRLLVDWCDGQARVAPMRRYGQEVELRRRQTFERVRGNLIAEDITLASLRRVVLVDGRGHLADAGLDDLDAEHASGGVLVGRARRRGDQVHLGVPARRSRPASVPARTPR
jgi:hypothetical protein